MKKSKEISSIILLLLCALALCLIMCFNLFVYKQNAGWLNILIYSLLSILMVCLVCTYAFKLETLFKLTVVISFFFLLVYFAYFMLTKYGIIEQINSFQDLKNLILSYRGWGLLTYTIINLLQVILIPIPSTLTILAGTAIFGPLMAFIFAAIGILSGSIIAFFIGRFCSKPLLYWIFTKEKVEKYEKFLSKRTKLILFLTLFLPFFPDDMICMLAGVTQIKFIDFLWISLLARSVGIASISFFGSGSIIPFNTWWGISLWAIILIFAITIGVFVYNKRKKIASLLIKDRPAKN